MTEKLVSIIVNCYNGEKYLQKTLESIQKQEYLNWELIFWDNQSSDNSKKIFDSFKDQRFKYYYADKHTTLYEARNSACKKSQGEFIAFLDCDDYWESNKIETQLHFMLNHGYDFSHTTYQIINYDRKIVGKIRAQGTIGYKELLKSCDIALSSVILKRKLLNDMEFPELKTKEDYVLWLGLAKKSVNLAGLDKSLMFWRQTPNSLSSSILQKLKDAFKVYYLYEKKNFFYSIFCVIRLSTYALFKKINVY